MALQLRDNVVWTWRRSLLYDLSTIARDADGDGRGPRTTPTGLGCRVFTGKPLACREENFGALNTADLRRLLPPANTAAIFAERIELLEDLELLLDFDPCLDLELLDDVGPNGCVISSGSFGPDCNESSLIGDCTDGIDTRRHRKGIGDVGESAEDGTEWRILMRSLP